MSLLNDLFSLKGRVSVVTGGAGHLGAAISEALAECGSTVYIVSRNVSQKDVVLDTLKKRYGTRIQHAVMDTSSTESIRECFENIVAEQNRIDVLVNNAYFGEGGSIETLSEESWNIGIEGTINSVFRCTKEVVSIMKRPKCGSIINIASMYGIVSPNPGLYEGTPYGNPPNYGAGKAAVIQFTRYSACYLAKYGIRVNAISPGPFPNDEVQKDKAFIEKLAEKTPLNRTGKPVDLKGVVALLASDASSYITGANFPVDGGWTAW